MGAARLSGRGDLLHPGTERTVQPGKLAPRQPFRHVRHGAGGADHALFLSAARRRDGAAGARSAAVRPDPGGDRGRRCRRPGDRAADRDDGDAAAGRRLPQPGRHGGGSGRRCRLSQSRGLRHRPSGHAGARSVDHQHPAGQPRGDGARRRDRRHHLLGVGDRLPEAQRQHVGQADHPAAAPCHQPRHADDDRRPRRLFHAGSEPLGVLDDHRPRASRSASS